MSSRVVLASALAGQAGEGGVDDADPLGRAVVRAQVADPGRRAPCRGPDGAGARRNVAAPRRTHQAGTGTTGNDKAIIVSLSTCVIGATHHRGRGGRRPPDADARGTTSGRGRSASVFSVRRLPAGRDGAPPGRDASERRCHASGDTRPTTFAGPARSAAERQLDEPPRRSRDRSSGTPPSRWASTPSGPRSPGPPSPCTSSRRVFEEAIGDTRGGGRGRRVRPLRPRQPALLRPRPAPPAARGHAAPHPAVQAGLKSLNDLPAHLGHLGRGALRGRRASTTTPTTPGTWPRWPSAPSTGRRPSRGWSRWRSASRSRCSGSAVGFPWSIAILHVPVLRMLQWKLHRPFNEFDGVEPRPYLDSPASLPAWMHLRRVAPAPGRPRPGPATR